MTSRRRAAALAALIVAAVVPLVPIGAPAAGAQAVDTAGGFDGDPATTERLNEGDPTHAAVDISEVRFDDGDVDHVVLSRDDSFADSVAGSGLTGDGPLLFTESDDLSGPTADEIARVLDPGDTVYVLGGTAAISPAVADELEADGYVVDRLAGENRVGTALEVADAVRALHPDGDDVLLARDSGWADSIAGGAVAAATGTPILVTGSDELDPAVAAWLAEDGTESTTLLGGTAALSDDVAAAVPDPTRVSGADRTATAAAVADQLWSTDDDQFVVAQGLSDDGWTYGFAAAGLAADADAPILLVTDEVTDATADLVSTCGEPDVDLEVVGDGGVVSPAVREQLDAADGFACGPDGALVYPADLTAFPACQDLLDELHTAALERVGPYGLDGFGGPMPVETLEDSPTAGDDTSGGSPTTNATSGTNNQEEGVDEPDVVKTDGEHAYVVAQGDLQVIDLDHGDPSVVATVDLPDDGSSQLLLHDDRLLVLTQHYRLFFAEDDASASTSLVAPGQGSEATTSVMTIDVSDPEDPEVTDTMDVDGDYRSARMIGSAVRLVLQSDGVALPFVYPTEATPEAEHDAAEQNRALVEASTLADWLPSYTIDGGDERALLDCSDVRRPALSSGLGTLSVVTIDLDGGIEPTSSAAVLASGESVYASTSRLYVTTGRWDWTGDALGSTVTTEVHAFDISRSSATRYIGSGSVEGWVLNQFALSELDGNLRIATTTEPPWSEEGEQLGETDNGVHVLDESSNGDLVEIGSITGLGAGERIFGVRFLGDLAAVVTFRQTDPLFLVDLSNPTRPALRGELHVTGYSSYLHRIDDEHLLGVGQEADADGRVEGMQVSLFDIADPSHPTLADRLLVPNGYSNAEYDSHAFLYWPATGTAVLPLETYGDEGSTFSGAVGIDVGDATVVEIGRTSHTDDVHSDLVYPAVNRSFVSDGILYTVSEGGIESSTLSSLDELQFARF